MGFGEPSRRPLTPAELKLLATRAFSFPVALSSVKHIGTCATLTATPTAPVSLSFQRYDDPSSQLGPRNDSESESDADSDSPDERVSGVELTPNTSLASEPRGPVKLTQPTRSHLRMARILNSSAGSTDKSGNTATSLDNRIQQLHGARRTEAPTPSAPAESSQSTSTPPLDWVIRAGAYFTSPHPFAELPEPAAVGMPLLPGDSVAPSDPQREMLDCLHHWIYEVPAHTELYAKLLAKLANQNRQLGGDERAELDRLRRHRTQYQAALRSAYHAIAQSPTGGYFYFLHPEFDVLFIRDIAAPGRPAHLEARISKSTMGLRRQLERHQIMFTSMSVTAAGAGVTPGAMASGPPGGFGDDGDANDYDSATDTVDSPPVVDAALAALSQRKHDNTAQSALYVTGEAFCQALLDFMVGWEDPRTERRLRMGPRLISPLPFLHARLARAEFRLAEAVQRTRRWETAAAEKCYTLAVDGPILPSHWSRLVTVLARIQRGELTVALPKEAVDVSSHFLNQVPPQAEFDKPAAHAWLLHRLHGLPVPEDTTPDVLQVTAITRGLVTRIQCRAGRFTWDLRRWK
ncbi:hypothetical protein IWQ60_002300 [Tieghemiomyces parasiticus]|uniref:Uncharacterized protein n=1 Tax=Tieghemiomyces parasiticus TaxID=78921 RepID=A0A9W8AHR2_9FUNG|nr:hypothetical protein IWQ60_002300 [Tieghemiomyces parasiticus]